MQCLYCIDLYTPILIIAGKHEQTPLTLENFDVYAIPADAACKRIECDVTTCSSYHQFSDGCLNIDINSRLCAAEEAEGAVKTRLLTGLVVPSSSVCNGRCDAHYSCEDEAQCGGFTYGGFCKDRTKNNKLVYIKPSIMCGGNMDWFCGPGIFNCSLEGDTCTSLYGGLLIPILNRTRCGAPWGDKSILTEKDKKRRIHICHDTKDQTNCTDPNRYRSISNEN